MSVPLVLMMLAQPSGPKPVTWSVPLSVLVLSAAIAAAGAAFSLAVEGAGVAAAGGVELGAAAAAGAGGVVALASGAGAAEGARSAAALPAPLDNTAQSC